MLNFLPTLGRHSVYSASISSQYLCNIVCMCAVYRPNIAHIQPTFLVLEASCVLLKRSIYLQKDQEKEVLICYLVNVHEKPSRREKGKE